jgi:aldose 1-epimerase
MRSIANGLFPSVFSPEQEIRIFTLRNSSGLEASISNYGGTVMSLKVPDRNGVFGNIVLGFEDISDYTRKEYLMDNAYMGAIVGRNANVIRDAAFSIEHNNYELNKNFGKHNLHGGLKGFDQHVWRVVSHETNQNKLTLFRISPNGEEGFPGNVKIFVTYELTHTNKFIIYFHAVTDMITPVNLTSHMYFNLAGSGTILDHELMISSDKYVEFNEALVPTGNIIDIGESPLNFSESKKIGKDIEMENDQLRYGLGYDLTYVLNGRSPAATLYDDSRGRFMEIETSLPGLHLYTSNTLAKTDWHGYGPRTGVCLEPQLFPDALHHPDFQSTLVHPGESYKHQITYTFSVKS